MNLHNLHPRLFAQACALVTIAFLLTAGQLHAQLHDTDLRGPEVGDTPDQHALVLQRFLAKESQNPRENQERFEEYNQDCRELFEIFTTMVREGEVDLLLALLRQMPEGVRGGIATGLIATAFWHNRPGIGDPGLQLALAIGIIDYYERTPEVPLPLLAFPMRQVPHIMAARPSAIRMVVGDISRLFDPEHEGPGGVSIRHGTPGDKTYRQWLGEHIQAAIEKHPELQEQYPRAADWAKGLLNPELTPEDLLKEFQGYARPSPGD